MSDDAVAYLRQTYNVQTVSEPVVEVTITVPTAEAIAQTAIANEHHARARGAAESATVVASSIPVEVTASVTPRKRGRPARSSYLAAAEPIRGEDI